MMWTLLALILVVAVIGGCAVVFGSGTASTVVERKIEVASENDVTPSHPKEKVK